MGNKIVSAGLVYFYLYGVLKDDQIALEVVDSNRNLPDGFYEKVCFHLYEKEDIPDVVHIFGVIGDPKKVDTLSTIIKNGFDTQYTGKMLIYQNEKGDTKIDVYFTGDTIWMTQRTMAELYQTTPQNITSHIKNIYEDDELDEWATCKDFLQVQNEGGREVRRERKFYNLDMILAVGYRVRSHVGTHFRKWASGVLTEYMKKGFVLNDERLKNPKEFGADYFDELLERIRDIRASEKRIYQKVKDIFALAVDYDGTTSSLLPTIKSSCTQECNMSDIVNKDNLFCDEYRALILLEYPRELTAYALPNRV